MRWEITMRYALARIGAALLLAVCRNPSVVFARSPRIDGPDIPSLEVMETLPVTSEPILVEECPPEKAEKKTVNVPVFVKQPAEEDSKAESQYFLNYMVKYDNGFFLSPIDPEKTPFEMKINAWGQIRHNAFSRSVKTYTDNTGTTRPVRNRNDFDIERARLIFSGYALSPKMTYLIHLDGDTDGQDTVDFFDYTWGFEFSKKLKVEVGKRKVPGSRQWLMTPRQIRLVDLPMANDFFRTDRSVGIFALGELADGLRYDVMAGNGPWTANVSPAEFNNRIAYSGTMYWEPFGEFGNSIVDFTGTEKLLMRIGHSFTYASQSGVDSTGAPLDESDYVRLSDGTRLNARGALAPGVTVSDFDVYLYAIDVAAKWRGWSADAEFYFRWIDDIQGDGPLPRSSLYQHGFFVEGGYFIIPKKVDLNVRYSLVAGEYGEHNEYGAGANWYPFDTQRLKISFDVTFVDGSPVNSTASDLLVGDNGTLFRTQLQAEF